MENLTKIDLMSHFGGWFIQSENWIDAKSIDESYFFPFEPSDVIIMPRSQFQPNLKTEKNAKEKKTIKIHENTNLKNSKTEKTN